MVEQNVTNEEIIAKMQQLGKGSEEYNKYAELLLTKNQEMVATVAYRLANEKGFMLDDVMQDLNLIMLKFANNFSADKNMNFSTYFFSYAPHYAKRSLNIYSGTYYGKEAKKNILNNEVKDGDKILNTPLYHDNNNDRMQKKLRNDRIMIADQYAIAYALSLDKPIIKSDDYEDESTMMDFMVDPSPTPLEKRINNSRLESINQALAILPKQLNEIIHKYYVENTTKTQIALDYGVSHELGRQYVIRATDILKETMSHSNVIHRIEQMKKSFKKYTTNSTTYPQHLLSNLPYSIEEIFEAIDFQILKYFNSLDINFQKLEQTRREWITQFNLKKSNFVIINKEYLDLYFDILFNDVEKDELIKKYQLPEQGKKMREYLYEIANPYLIAYRQTQSKNSKVKSNGTSPSKLEEKLILYYKGSRDFYHLEEEVQSFSSQQQLILKNLYGEQLSVNEVAEKLNLSKIHITRQKRLMLTTLTFALKDELQSLNL